MGAAAGIVSYLGAGLIDTPSIGKPGILLWVLLGTVAAAYRMAPAPRGARAPDQCRDERPCAFSYSPGSRLPALLALALVVLPGALAVNMASLEAHRALLDVRSTGQPDLPALRAASDRLQAAGPQAGSNPHVYNLLGSVLAWQGDGEGALAALEKQVAIDLDDPFWRYAPFEALRRSITGEQAGEPAPELLRVYGQWMARFPHRAETYAAAALVYERTLGDAGRARLTLESGLNQNAQPAGLLEHHLARILAGG